MIRMNRSEPTKEDGIALFMAIFALMLLSAIAAGFMFLSNTETAVNMNYRASQQAYFGARAGLQEARERIMSGSVPGDLNAAAYSLTMPNAATQTGGIYITNPRTGDPAIQPWDAANKYFDDTLCKANFTGLGMAYGAQGARCTAGPGTRWVPIPTASNDATTNTAAALPYKWVRITLKSNLAGSPQTAGGAYPYAVDNTAALTDNRPVCWTGTQQMLLPAGYTDCKTPPSIIPAPVNGNDPYRPVFLIASLAVTPSGSQRTLSMEAADDPPTIVHGAVVSNDNVNTVGTSAQFYGADNCKCSCTTTSCTNRATGAACTDGYSPITVSAPHAVSSSGHPPIVPPTTTPATPPTQVVSPFPYDIPSLIARYKNAGGTINASTSQIQTSSMTAPYNLPCTGSLTATPPTASCGSVSGGTWGIQPTNFSTLQSGSPVPVGNVNQTTYIPGNLDLQAHNSGSGILVVDGDLTIHGGITFYGLIIVKGAVTFTGGGGGGGSNIIGSLLSGQSASADTLGGSVNIQYDQCALSNDQTVQPPRVLSTREIEY